MKLSELFKNGTAVGIAIGAGAVVAAAAVIPALPSLARALRPTARAAIKSGLLLAERGRELVAEAGEELEDIVAEARAELRRDKVFGDAADDDQAQRFAKTQTFADDL